MFPGFQSKVSVGDVASATTIQVKTDLVRITGSTQIETINSQLKLDSQGGVAIFVVAVDGAVVLGTAGNILVGQSLAQNRLYMLIFSAKQNKWYIHGVA